jgi:hypothetical protein
MNPRCTPLSHLQLGTGRDLVEALCAQVTGQPLREIPAVTQNPMIAYFPQASICKSKFLESSFHDIPREDPDLVKELLEPWSERSLVAGLVDRFRRLTKVKGAAKEYIFADAFLTDTEFSEARAKPEDTPYQPRSWADAKKRPVTSSN